MSKKFRMASLIAVIGLPVAIFDLLITELAVFHTDAMVLEIGVALSLVLLFAMRVIMRFLVVKR